MTRRSSPNKREILLSALGKRAPIVCAHEHSKLSACWFALQEITGVEEAHTELLKGYAGKEEPDQMVHERLARARLFHVLILVKIVVRRVPIYKKEWATMTARMIERADQVLHKTIVI